MQGTIKKLMKDKYFGFITPEGGDKDLFFHANEVDGASFEELNEGDAVTFEVNETPKGPAATSVKKA
jgi:cold shock protein